GRHVRHPEYRLVHYGSVRAGDDDRATPTFFVGLHHPRRFAHRVEHAVEIDADRLVPALRIVDVDLPLRIARAFGRPETIADIEPGIGERDVAAAIGPHVIVEGTRDLRQVADVAGGPAHFVAFVGQPLRLARRAFGIDVGQRHPRPGLGHALGVSEADPARRAGDQRRTAADVELVEGLGALHLLPLL